jgi:penicillin amidase
MTKIMSPKIVPQNVRKKSILVKTGIVSFIIIMAVFSLAYWLIIRPWPQMDGTIKIPGLQDKVTVLMDKWGTPNIYAQNEHDLFMTQGFIHAQNRMWQMELNRAQGNGRLSSILGKKVIDYDINLRIFGLRRVAEKTWKELDKDTRNILFAYAEGVNAYLELHKNNLPIEFNILHIKPAHWTPIDTLAFGNLMGYILSGNLTQEYLRANMVAKIGPDLTEQLFPPRAAGTPLIIPNEAENYKNLMKNKVSGVGKRSTNFCDDWTVDTDDGIGSNDWTVHGSRTKNGKPMLANDMHLGLGLPSWWYQNGLHGGRFDCVGFSFTGVPGIIVGHNQSIAWGVTNLNPDTQDLYMEKLDDVKHPTKYQYKGQWFKLDVIHEVLNVKGGEKVPFNIYFTKHGPILPTIMGHDVSATPLAMKSAIEDGNGLFAAAIQVNLASNWQQFRKAVSIWDNPGENFVYADVNGNIGYQCTGKVPIRRKNHNGLLPVPGWRGEYEWTGFIPFEDMPDTFNPSQGFAATANNQIIADDYPFMLTLDWYPGFRAKRICDMLAASNKLTINDMKNIQSQVYSIPADTLCPYILATKPDDEQEKIALQKIREWDHYVKAGSVGAGIYEVWLINMIKNTISDELGDQLTTDYLSGNYQRHASQTITLIMNLLKDKNHVFWDNIKTPQKENREDIVKKSFKDTLTFYGKNVGKDINQWSWGRVHTLTFKHWPLGTSGNPLLRMLFNDKTYPYGGDHFTVSEAGFRRGSSYEVVHGPSQRMIIDLNDFNNSIWVNSSGQTENLWHPNRKDTLPLWYHNQYYRMDYSAGKVEAAKRHELLLVP